MKILSFGEVLFDEIDGEKHPGGAPLNFSVHMARKGAEVFLLSCLGSDEDGEKLLEFIKNQGINTSYISFDKNHTTGISRVVIDKKGVPSFDIVENVSYDFINFDDIDKTDLIDTGFDCFYFGTLAQRQKTSRQSLKAIIKNIKTDKIFCDLNLRQDYFTKEIIEFSLENSDIVKLSRAEFSLIGKMFFPSQEEEHDLAKKIINKFSLDLLLVTYGGEGCRAFTKELFVVSPAKKVKIVDTIGAGDSFSAAFLSVYLKDKDIQTACYFANAYSAVTLGKAGAI